MTSIIKVDNIQNASGTSALEIDSSGIVTLSDVGQGQFYKSGTFSPVVADASTGGNVSSTSAEYANYLKIGQLVFVNFRFTSLSSSGLTAANQLYFRDLPYTPVNNAVLNIWVQEFNLDQYGNPVARSGTNQKWVRLEFLKDNTVDHPATIGDIETGETDIIISGCYMTNDDA